MTVLLLSNAPVTTLQELIGYDLYEGNYLLKNILVLQLFRNSCGNSHFIEMSVM